MKTVNPSRHPVSDEIAAALGRFVLGGTGPTHSALTNVFERAGYGDAAPYHPNDISRQMNKLERVRLTIQAAINSPARARELIDAILAEYRVFGFFNTMNDPEEERQRLENYQIAKRAFMRSGWQLTEAGEVFPTGVTSIVATEGRPAINEQLDRLRRGLDDPALMLGTAKEMLESTAKHVYEAFSVPYRQNTSFNELWHHARDRLKLLPDQVEMGRNGAEELREILQSSWSIAKMTNKLRNNEGTGHGRTLPTAISPSVALFVVREACNVVQLVLETLDNQMGR